MPASWPHVSTDAITGEVAWPLRSERSLYAKDTETVLMHGTLVSGAAIKPAHRDYECTSLVRVQLWSKRDNSVVPTA